MKKSKKVFITGAGRGLGFETAIALLKSGWSVGICIREHSLTNFDKHKELITKTGSKIFIADLCDEKQVLELAKSVKNWCDGSLDGLVNNAGIAHGGLIQGTPLSEVRDVFDVNFFAVISITQRLFRYLRKAEKSSIINISSISSLIPESGQIAYGASKAALNSLTKSMAQEYRRNNINVNAILPAAIDTGMSSEMSQKSISEQTSLMAHKELIESNDVIELILFLLENRAQSITGQLIRVDNGIIF